MSKYRIVECRGDDAYRLWIKFEDGLAGSVDLSNLVGRGVFAAWQNKKFFKTVTIDATSGTVCWNSDLDLDARTLRRDIEQNLAQQDKTIH